MRNAESPDEETKELYAYGAGLQSLFDIAGLERFVKLECLSLHGNHIQRIQGLEGLPLLKELNLSSNNIKEMEGLAKLSQLQVLNLSCNYIEEIQDLQGLLALRKLLLSHNRISCLGGVSALHGPRYALQLLDLRDNVVSSLAELEVLAGCVNLTELIFSWGHHSNPVCQAPAYKSAVVAAVPHIHKLDGRTLCPGSGLSCIPEGLALIGCNVGSKNAGSLLPPWALEYKDYSLQDIPVDRPHLNEGQLYQKGSTPTVQSSICPSLLQHDTRASPLFQVSSEGNVCQLPLPSEWETVSHPETSSWVNQPSSSHLLSMNNLAHPHSRRILTSSDLQTLGPGQRPGLGDSSVKSCAGLSLRKQYAKVLNIERNCYSENVQEGLHVPKADRSSQTNYDAWLGALEEKILDLVQQLPSVKAEPQGDLIGHHDDAVATCGGSKVQRLNRRDALRHGRKQNGGDSKSNELKADCSSGDTPDCSKDGLKALGRPLSSNGDSRSASPECESPARRWVHFGEKSKRKKDLTKPGRNLVKEVAVSPENDALEQLFEEVKILQAGLASLTAMSRGGGDVPQNDKLKEQSDGEIELKQDKEEALCKLTKECSLMESKLANSEEKFSEERSSLLKRLESEQEERKKFQDLLRSEQEERKNFQDLFRSEQEERNKLHEDLKAQRGEINKLHQGLKAEQEERSDLLKSLGAKQSTICQLERTLQERDVTEKEMSTKIEKLAAQRGQVESFLQEKYRGRFLSLNTELVSLKEALHVATMARQNAERELLDATSEKESSRQLALSVGQLLEEEKAKLGLSNSELEACRSLVGELREQVDNSSKDILDENIKHQEALEQLSKGHLHIEITPEHTTRSAISRTLNIGKKGGDN